MYNTLSKHRVFAFALLPLLLLGAADPKFVGPGEFDADTLLAPPPAMDSAEAKTELDLIFQLQRSRTPAEVARAKSEAKLTPAAFAPIMGDGFTADNLPKLFSLLTDVAADSKILSDGVKKQFDLECPQFADSRIAPAIDGETDASYPSGHATRGMLWAKILVDLVPNKKDQLIGRGQEIGWDRVIAGVHYPSDVYAGRILGQNLGAALKKNADFQKRFVEARMEYDAFSAAHQTASRDPAAAH